VRKWVLFIIILGLASYSYARMMGGGMMGQATSSPTPPPKNSAPDIKKGYGLVQTFCVECHQSPNPAQHTPAEWPGVLDRMHRYMRAQHRPVPTAADRKLILDYLSKTH